MYIMVLNDGETWTELPGCKIVYLDIGGIGTTDDVDDERVKTAYKNDSVLDEVVTEFK